MKNNYKNIFHKSFIKQALYSQSKNILKYFPKKEGFLKFMWYYRYIIKNFLNYANFSQN